MKMFFIILCSIRRDCLYGCFVDVSCQNSVSNFFPRVVSSQPSKVNF